MHLLIQGKTLGMILQLLLNKLRKLLPLKIYWDKIFLKGKHFQIFFIKNFTSKPAKGASEIINRLYANLNLYYQLKYY